VGGDDGERRHLYGGASFPLRHGHGVGRVLLLSAPLPCNFRRYDLAGTSYKSYALGTQLALDRQRHPRVGVMFLGAFRPGLPGQARRPRNCPPTRAGDNARFEHLARIGIATSGYSCAPELKRRAWWAVEEQTVTENLSRGGARVFTTLPVSRADAHGDDFGRPSGQAHSAQHLRGARPRDAANLSFPTCAAELLRAAGTPPLPPEAS
jgi:hypothetical protein